MVWGRDDWGVFIFLVLAGGLISLWLLVEGVSRIFVFVCGVCVREIETERAFQGLVLCSYLEISLTDHFWAKTDLLDVMENVSRRATVAWYSSTNCPCPWSFTWCVCVCVCVNVCECVCVCV